MDIAKLLIVALKSAGERYKGKLAARSDIQSLFHQGTHISSELEKTAQMDFAPQVPAEGLALHFQFRTPFLGDHIAPTARLNVREINIETSGHKVDGDTHLVLKGR